MKQTTTPTHRSSGIRSRKITAANTIEMSGAVLTIVEAVPMDDSATPEFNSHWKAEIPSWPKTAARSTSVHGMRNRARKPRASSASAIDAKRARNQTMDAGSKLDSAARIAGKEAAKAAVVRTKMTTICVEWRDPFAVMWSCVVSSPTT